MEKAGLVKCMSFIERNKKTVNEVITDRRPSIQKYMREQHPDFDHSFDVWRIAKGIYHIFKYLVLKNYPAVISFLMIPRILLNIMSPGFFRM